MNNVSEEYFIFQEMTAVNFNTDTGEDFLDLLSTFQIIFESKCKTRN